MAILVKEIEQKLNLALVLLFIFTLSIFVVINSPWLYAWGIQLFHLTAVTHLSFRALMKCYFSMIRYLQVPRKLKLNLIYFKSSRQGLIHFSEVRHLVLINNSLLLFLAFWNFEYVKRLSNFKAWWSLIIPFRIMVTTILVLLTVVLVNFQAAFIMFHKLLFRNRDWLFTKQSDPVILALPNEYFLMCFLAVVLLIISGLILSLLTFRFREDRQIK